MSFLPRSTGVWEEFAPLEDLFAYDGAGVMPGRTWVIAPDRRSLERRWEALQSELDWNKREALFHPHLQGDRHINKLLQNGWRGHEVRDVSIATDTKPVIQPVRYGYRSFDRQWIIPDARLINRPNPTLWAIHSSEQVYMTALHRTAPTAGPGVTFSAAIPDLDHYHGRGGRVFPLWADRAGTTANVKAGLLRELVEALGGAPTAPDLMAYLRVLQPIGRTRRASKRTLYSRAYVSP